MVQIDGTEVGPIGYGLMSFTTSPTPIPFEHSIKVLKAAVDKGVLFWDGGEFYGPPERNSLHLIRKYFETYPEDKAKVRFNIKGAIDHARLKPDSSEAGIEKSMEFCQEILGDIPLDMFEPARFDPDLDIDITLNALKKAYDNGKVRGIGLSEVSERTIERAHQVLGDALKSVELELNLCDADFLEDGAVKACAKHNIPLLAYSPLSRGLLTGRYTMPEHVPKHLTALYPRFQGENLINNLKLVHALIALAGEKSTELGSTVSPSQLALSWGVAMSQRDGNPTIMPIPSATTFERMEENFSPIPLSDADLANLKRITDENVILGARYLADQGQYLAV